MRGIDYSFSQTNSLIPNSGVSLSDVDQHSIRTSINYEYSELLGFDITYRFRQNEISANQRDAQSILDSERMTGVDFITIIVGARGSLTSLLDGNVDLGVFRRELNDGMGGQIRVPILHQPSVACNTRTNRCKPIPHCRHDPDTGKRLNHFKKP